jgi:hypothetical protein
VKAKSRRSSGEGVEWYFDGPLGKALDALQGIYREAVEARREQRTFADERNKKLDVQTDLLRDIKECVTRERTRRRS